MALDPKYICDSTLCDLFRDKDTGLPLRFGFILFYKDNARQIGKPVYKLVGSPPNYTYTEYGQNWLDPNGNIAWRVDLNAQGYLDNALYYYPYDETGNNVELYFVQVYSSDNVIINPTSILQFSREAWPPDVVSSSVTGTVVDINYVPDGQFLMHEDLPKTATYEAGEIRSPITDINYGGWTFERPTSTTSKDFVTFERFGSFVINPNSNPRYAVRIECEQPNAGDGFKDLRLKFNDVNKFNTTEVGKVFTFAFYAVSNAGGNLNASLILYKNYGTGGSTPTETSITNFTITTSYTQYYASFSFGDNTGKTLGTLNDDYLQIVLRLPVDAIFDASFTDFLLTPDNVISPIFPDQTNSQFVYRALAGYFPIPAYDGSDLNLYPVLTKNGWRFDDSQIGFAFPSLTDQVPVGYLPADGTGYDSTDKSSDGIPYSRVANKFWISSLNTYRFGSGPNFITASPFSFDASFLIINNNEIASVPNCTDGATSTGFNFFPMYSGNTQTYCYGRYAGTTSNEVFLQTKFIGPTNGVSAGTSGFTIQQVRSEPATTAFWAILTIAAATLAGKYFEFNTWNGANVQNYMWFTVDGVGADPAPGGTGFKVDLRSSYSAADVAKIVSKTLNGFVSTEIGFVAGSSVVASSYWEFSTTLQDYYVWYTKDGVGTDPNVGGKKGIQVSVLSTDSAIQVAQKTQIALNQRFVAMPDMRGQFIRGWDNGAGVDPTTSQRWGTNDLLFGDQIGTFQRYDFEQHTHTAVGPTGWSVGTNFFPSVEPHGIFSETVEATDPPPPPWTLSVTVNNAGGAEDVPVNISGYWLVKY